MVSRCIAQGCPGPEPETCHIVYNDRHHIHDRIRVRQSLGRRPSSTPQLASVTESTPRHHRRPGHDHLLIPGLALCLFGDLRLVAHPRYGHAALKIRLCSWSNPVGSTLGIIFAVQSGLSRCLSRLNLLLACATRQRKKEERRDLLPDGPHRGLFLCGAYTTAWTDRTP